jgi:hypothetical protein
VRSHADRQSALVEAVTARRWRDLFPLFLSDPLVAPLGPDRAHALVRDMLEATAKRLLDGLLEKVARHGTQSLLGLAFLAPYIIGLLIFTALPFLASLYLSSTDYSLMSPPKWSGLDNYIEMFTRDRTFQKSLKVTLLYVFLTVPLKLAARAERLGLMPGGTALAAKVLETLEGRIENGRFGGICHVAGLGGFGGVYRNATPEYYLTELVVEDDAKGPGR